jgi:peptidoglycan/LPS O-acetylase OafA/YrhL
MSLSNRTMPERFVQLDALRFLFAVVVVMVHTIGRSLAPAHGSYAVDFFFVLSGFVLSHALIDRPLAASEFAWARLARLYPLHLMTLAWLACLVGGVLANPPRHYSLEALGLNLVLLQGAWALETHAWNFPSWSISVEFLVNALVLYPIVRARNVLLAAVLVVLAWLIILLSWGAVFDEFTVQTVAGTHIAGGLVRGAGGIVLGYLLYEAYLVLRPRAARSRGLVWPATIFEVAAATVLVACLWVDRAGWNVLSAPLSAILILQMATCPGQLGRFLQTGPFAQLGNISYSIYLIHIPLFAMFEAAGLLQVGGVAFRPVWFAYFALLLLLSVVSYRYLERPAQRGLMRLFKGWRTTPSHEPSA